MGHVEDEEEVNDVLPSRFNEVSIGECDKCCRSGYFFYD
jgi:hypothetical protein